MNYWQNSDFAEKSSTTKKKTKHLSYLSLKQYELCLETLFIVFMLGQNREPVTLFPEKSNIFSSFRLGIASDTWKHYCGACLHLSSVLIS